MAHSNIAEWTAAKISACFCKTNIWSLKKRSRNQYMGRVYLFMLVTQSTVLPYIEEIQIYLNYKQSRWGANVESLPKWCKQVIAKKLCIYYYSTKII